MPSLEKRDPRTGKWLLYDSEVSHGEDCARHPFEEIPLFVFLDTCVVNLLVKFGNSIYEQEPISECVPLVKSHDVEALMHIMQTSYRANWVATTSPKALQELSATPDYTLRDRLTDFGGELFMLPGISFDHAIDLGRRSVDSTLLDCLPDRSDRELIGNAVGLGCDVFCTSDRKTIIRFRQALPALPLRVLTPVEWWRSLKPWIGLAL